MLTGLRAPGNAVVIMDSGIATEDNLRWLRDNAYRYLVVARATARVFDADETRAIGTAPRDTVTVYKEIVALEDGTDCKDARLRRFSAARAEKERSNVNHFKTRLEDGLQELHDGLSRPRTCKKLDYNPAPDRSACRENARVARHYEITATADSTGAKAAGIAWSLDPVDDAMPTYPGIYCLRSNILDWQAETTWQT